jgi:hypothetical protein
VEELSLEEALERLQGVGRAVMAAMVERRTARPPGAATRLQQHLLAAVAEAGGLTLTEAGGRALEEHRARQQRRLARLLGLMTGRERWQLVELAQRMAALLEEHPEVFRDP